LNDVLDAELFVAVYTKNNDGLFALLQRGANPNAVHGRSKEPALSYASRIDNVDAVNLLVQAVRCSF
jgi:hypothetical protein